MKVCMDNKLSTLYLFFIGLVVGFTVHRSSAVCGLRLAYDSLTLNTLVGGPSTACFPWFT